ncbi:MAG: hypothetical protein J0I98_23355 [Mesorhizobium sp.]|uniref:hypothetical protein n=1 Tax=Mesorhizobium hunchu TaxID=3157708 RepID=UPI001AC1EC4C|nr:hypothetical protein [Mesorhizobium sp.]MBN9245714.1 hypothetical protein [Mesorhizobium sp.]
MQPGSSLGVSLHVRLAPSLLPCRRAHASMALQLRSPSLRSRLLAATLSRRSLRPYSGRREGRSP